MKENLNKFSVPLGLLDYINPIFYSITMVTIRKNMYYIMKMPYNIIFLIGAIISIFFGFIIPTGKVIVGLGIIEFRMPVSIVFCVNSGILLSGLMFSKHIMNMSLKILIIIAIIVIVLLILLYIKTRKFNTIAVLIGAFGYMLLYISLITIAIQNNIILPIILCIIAILLFIMLCGIGIKADLKNPKIHWIIEISNVLCQCFVALATIIIFMNLNGKVQIPYSTIGSSNIIEKSENSIIIDEDKIDYKAKSEWDSKNVIIKVKEDSITNTSAIINIEDKNEIPKSWGLDFAIQISAGDGKWEDLITKEITTWNEIVIKPNENGITQMNLDWTNIYGKLNKGVYRIVKYNGANTIFSEPFTIK